jgi:5-methylthioribose kinase
MGIIPTLNINTNQGLKNSDIQEIKNPLCETTKTYVFSEPFMKNSNKNDIYELSKEFIELEVYQDNVLLRQIEKLKRQFMNKKQALIHGDLHTGSIFVNKSSIIIFDYEFAFNGPIGFDIGNLLAHLIFSWLHAKSLGQKKEFMDCVENTIKQIIDKFKKNFASEFEVKYNSSSHYSSEYIAAYVEDIIHDTAAFAGVELIRRIVGIAHVRDITMIENPEKRAEAELIAVKLAKSFIMNNKQFHCGTDFVKEIKVFNLI